MPVDTATRLWQSVLSSQLELRAGAEREAAASDAIRADVQAVEAGSMTGGAQAFSLRQGDPGARFGRGMLDVVNGANRRPCSASIWVESADELTGSLQVSC